MTVLSMSKCKVVYTVSCIQSKQLLNSDAYKQDEEKSMHYCAENYRINKGTTMLRMHRKCTELYIGTI